MKFNSRVIGKKKTRANERVFLDHVHMRGASYANQTLGMFGTFGCRLEHCNFENIRIEGAKFGSGNEMSEFIECNFDGTFFNHCSGGNSRFVRCSFRDVDLHHWITREVELVDCVFSGRLHTAIFNGRVREEKRSLLKRDLNEFHGNDFSNMDLIDVSFRTGVDLSKQRLPSSPEYLYLPNANSAVQRARQALLGWPELELRRVALVMIKNMEQTIAEGQEQFFLRASDYYPHKSLPRKAVDTLFALLRGDELLLS